MSAGRTPAIALLVGISVAALLAGCGSSTNGVSATRPAENAQAPVTSTQTATATSVSQTMTQESTTTTQTQAAGGGGTAAPTPRTASEPAFTEAKVEAKVEDLSDAEAILHAHGYTAADPSEYHEDQALRVLIGSHTGDQEQAFFFVNGRYIGTDAKEPSGDIQVIAQSDTEVTLGYSLYKPGNSLCCPGGGVAKVRFQLDNGLLTTLDPLPPVNSSSAASRQ